MPDARKIVSIRIDHCIECPYAFEAGRMTNCTHPEAPMHEAFFDWNPIPDWCPLVDVELLAEETTP